MRLILIQQSTHQLLLPITDALPKGKRALNVIPLTAVSMVTKFLMAVPKVVSLINLGVDIASVSMVMMTASMVMMAAAMVMMTASMVGMTASMVMMMTMVMAASVMTGRNKSCNVKFCVSYFNLQTFHAHDCINSLIHHKRQEIFWISNMHFIIHLILVL